MKPTLFAVACALGFPAAALAGSCGYTECWGTVAVGPGGAWGYAHGMISEDAAYNAAQGYCEGDCTQLHSFFNACGAIAVASNGATGWAIDTSRENAENAALGYCAGEGRGCTVRVWACSK